MSGGEGETMELTKESLILILLSLMDLLVTLFLLHTKAAVEGNPFMALFLNYGMGAFAGVKLSVTAFTVYIFEWCRQYKPRFVSLMVRSAIAAYLAIYLGLFLVVNVP